jgi:hypothetical protein
MQLPKFWLVVQALLMLFVAAAIVIAAVKL